MDLEPIDSSQPTEDVIEFTLSYTDDEAWDALALEANALNKFGMMYRHYFSGKYIK